MFNAEKCCFIEASFQPVSLHAINIPHNSMFFVSKEISKNSPVEINERVHWFFADLTGSWDDS